MVSPDALDRCKAAWPELSIDDELFSAYVAARVKAGQQAPSDEGLAELYLACGCHNRDERALELFDTRYLSGVSKAIAHMRLGDDTTDEVRQLVRHKLLVANEGQPTKLDGYAGGGKLGGLIQVIAVRTAISLIRKRKGTRTTADGLEELPDGGHDPELAFMKQKYRAAFKVAFEAALNELSPRDRNFLRLHHFGGLTVEQVGAVYDVHRGTATRWLAKIRKTLMTATRKHLGAELSVKPEELDSLMVLIQSRLDVSVQRLLEEPVDGEPLPDGATPGGAHADEDAP